MSKHEAFKTVTIIPTGDEIKEGVVLDTDSPEILSQLIKLNPLLTVKRLPPVLDKQEAILHLVEQEAEKVQLIILIGGSGGGHRFSPSLGRDYTHSALEEILQDKVSHQIFGKNGHLWCKLICGHLGQALVINLPGPFTEAKAAMEAFCSAASWEDLTQLNTAMTKAVLGQYPIGVTAK